MSLAQLLTTSAARFGERPAIRLDGAALSYAALDEASARVAGLLIAKGVRPGDRVGVMLPNVPAFAACYYGALRAGTIVVPLNVQLKEREVAFHLADSGARVVLAALPPEGAGAAEVVLAEPGFADAAEPAAVVERSGDETAVLLYTSGTTGSPKGAELTHANLVLNVATAVDLFGLGPDTVTLGALPLFHAFGQTCGLNATIAAGGCLTLLPRFDPGAALAIVERDGVTVFEGVPTMYAAMLHHPAGADTSSLRVCVSGGAAMPAEVMRAFEERFGCAVLEGYGLSETSPVASFNRRDRERRPGSIGLPIDGVEMKLLDAENGVGEIAIRGHNVMKGYWRRPDATAAAIDADGWFRTGDVGTVDEDGYFFIVDRKKDMIIRGGYNVYPREIEEVLYEHPAVREAAVVGIPHPELGEDVGAAVALVDGAVHDAAELREFVKERVAAYKYPRHVWLVDALPKGPTGKILKREIAVPELQPLRKA